MAVVAIEVTVVTTAMPTVIGELRGLELYPWVFSAYLLASTVTVPIFGKLADLYGRKPIFLGGMVVFLLGSILCGLATSMPALVGFRALQGLGAGAVQPLVFTIIGDVYPLKDRGKVQGLFSGVWAVASLAGPSLGAFLTEGLSWRWVFFVNVPFALLASWFIWRFLTESFERRAVRIDVAGAVTLSAGLLILLVTALEGGRSLPWGSPLMLALLGASVLLIVLFFQVERRAASPLLPLGIFGLPIIAVAMACNVIQGAHLFALTAYVPLYVQGVRGESAAATGAALTPLLLGWALSAVFGPKLLLRFGFRSTALVGTGLLLVGSVLLLRFDQETSPLLITLCMLLLGSGFGPSTAAFMVAVQAAVSWELRGVVTSTSQLFRSLGGTVGVALLGALLNSRLQTALPNGGTDRAALLNVEAREALDPATLAALQNALAGALQPVFLVLVALAVLGIAIVLRWATNAPIVAARPTDLAAPPAANAESSSSSTVSPGVRAG